MRLRVQVKHYWWGGPEDGQLISCPCHYVAAVPNYDTEPGSVTVDNVVMEHRVSLTGVHYLISPEVKSYYP